MTNASLRAEAHARTTKHRAADRRLALEIERHDPHARLWGRMRPCDVARTLCVGGVR